MKEKRLQQLENYIKSYHMCTYEELMAHFDVSKSTIRRDIGELCRYGTVRKTYGGVTFAEGDAQDKDDDPKALHYESVKDAIAKEASLLVEDNDIIILGSGSTVAHMVHHLEGKRNITLITNNLIVVEEAIKYDFNVINVGGNLNRHTMSFVGTSTTKQLKDLNANKAFVSCNGITGAHGFSNVSDLESAVKKVIIGISTNTYVLADHKKFDTLSLYTYAGFEEVEMLITDTRPSDDYMDLFKKAHMKCKITNEL